jgi:TP901 family phage tail tape measure protein
MAAGGKFIGGIRVGVSMDTKKLARDTRKAKGLIGAFGKSALRTVGTLTGAAGLAGSVLKAGMAFETLSRSMNRSLAIMGDVSSAMRTEMRNAAIEVSRTVTASASQVADSFYFLASAGLDATQALKALPTVAEFAQAGNFNLALATDLLTDAQTALGLSSKDTAKSMKEMNRVSDVLVKANTLANASVQQFSEALTNKAGAALRLLGKDVEEGVAVLAAFADQGIKGAEAGTGFGIILRDLQTKAIKFSSKFKEAGVTVFDTSGDMRNMADIMGDLEDKMDGLSDKAKKSFLLDLGFSDKSVAFVQALVGTSEKIRSYESALSSAGGTTKEVAGKMMTDLEKSMANLSASFTKAASAMQPLVELTAKLLGHLADIIGLIPKPQPDTYGDRQRSIASNQKPSRNAPSKVLQELVKGWSLQNLKGEDIGPRETAPQDKGREQFRERGHVAVAKTKEVVQTLMKTDFKNIIKNASREMMGVKSHQEGMMRNVFDSIGGGIHSGLRSASAFGGRAKMGAFGLQRDFAITKGNFEQEKARKAAGTQKEQLELLERQGKQKVGDVAFAQSGSAESFRQQARIRRQAEGNKMEKTRTKDIAKIREALTRAPLVVGEANFGGST